MNAGHLNGKEFNGRAIIADGRNDGSPILVRDLKVCKPTGSTSTRPSSGDGSSTAPDTPSYATGGPVSYPDSSLFSSPTSTTGSSFSHQVRPSSHTTSSSYSSSSSAPRQQDLQLSREYQCLVSLPAAHELMMPRPYAQQQDGGVYMSNNMMSMASSGYMTGPGVMSFSYDTAGGFSHPSAYGFGHAQEASYPQQAFTSAAYPTSSSNGGAQQALYNAPPSTSYAVQPPIYNDYYLPAVPASTSAANATTASLTAHMSNMGLGGGGDVIYTEQRGVHIRDISRRASEDQIRKMIREVTGPEAALIDSIKVPTLQDGAPRGHAFVHFRSASLARRLVDFLNGQDFKGRKLQVRLMKEGDAIAGGAGGSLGTLAAAAAVSSSASSSKHRSSGKHHHHGGSGGGDCRRSERRAEKSSSATTTTSSKIKASSKSSPLVVGTPVTASKEKHGGKKSLSVVIADGS